MKTPKTTIPNYKTKNVSNNMIINYYMDIQKLLQQWKFSQKIVILNFFITYHL